MLERLDLELVEIRESIRRKEKLERDRAALQVTIAEESRRLAALQRRLAAEQEDVDKLEGLSLTNMFYTVLGGKDERLEKEKQELLAAKLRHDEADATLAALRKQLEDVGARLAEIDRAKDEVRGVLLGLQAASARRPRSTTSAWPTVRS